MTTITVTRDAREYTFHGAEDLTLFLLNDLAPTRRHASWLETVAWDRSGRRWWLAAGTHAESASLDCFVTAHALWENAP